MKVTLVVFSLLFAVWTVYVVKNCTINKSEVKLFFKSK